MKLLRPLLVACLCLVVTLAVSQTPADLGSEPHHDLLLQNDQMRVFAVTLKATEQAYVQHEHNFLLVTLQNCELVIWAEGRSAIQSYRLSQGDVRFFFGGRALGLRNDRTNEYRGIMVEFLDPKVTTYGYQRDSGTWDYGDSVLRPPVDPHAKFSNSISLGAATASDVQLLADDALPAPEKEAAELLIPVTDIDLKAGESERVRKSAGEAAWVPPGRKSKLQNADIDAVRLIVIEFKLQTTN
jgi:hypothetical protein